MIEKTLWKNAVKLSVLMMFIGSLVGAAQAQTEPNPTNEIKVSLMRLNKESGKEEIIKEFSVSTKEFEKVEAEIVNGGSRRTEIKIEQFKINHPAPERVWIKLESRSAKSLAVDAVAVFEDGRLENLFDSSEGAAGELLNGQIIQSENLTTAPGSARYIIAVHKQGFERIDFSEGLAFGSGQKQMAGAAMLSNLGAIFESRGEFEKSIEFYEAYIFLAKGILKKLSEKPMDFQQRKIYLRTLREEAAANNNLGLLWYKFSRYDKSLEYYQTALKILAQLPDDAKRKAGQAATFDNLAQTYNSLGRFDAAQENFQKSLDLWKNLQNEQGEEGEYIVLNNLGTAHSSKQKYREAVAFFEKALQLNPTTEDKSGRAVTLNNLAFAKRALGDYDGAEKLIAESLALSSAGKNRNNTAFAYNNLGLVKMGRKDFPAAVSSFQQALPIYRELGNRTAESYTLSHLMFAAEKLNEPRLAILFGKQSVNLTQGTRSEISKLDKVTQDAFLESRLETYRKLVSLLIAQGAIPEAEQVLSMLKEEETFSFVRRDDSLAKAFFKTFISLTDNEQEIITEYDRIANQITALGKEFNELDAERKNFAEGQFPKQARFEQLRQLLNAAVAEFRKFLAGLNQRFGANDVRVVQVDKSLKATLQTLKANRTAVVSTIIGKDELNIIVTTSGTQRAHQITIPEKEINELVVKFRFALTRPNLDPRPDGQKLYNLLVKPIEADLAGIDADTIVWSLDGTLRYVPTAALWDKEKGYLAERFASVFLTLSSRDKLLLPVTDKQNWKALGVGVSEKWEDFPQLDKVPDELDCIITDEQDRTVSTVPRCQTGVLNGKKMLNEKFTFATFENALGRYPLVHIASHFSLKPGSEDDSFLLLGGGSQRRFTVTNLRGISLAEVELIALSACNTATPGGEKADGLEIEGFGAIAQEQGAKSVMATLWAVADNSTAEWMIKFYELYGKGNLSKAEAMKKAQIAMMYGKYKATDGNTRRDGVEVILDGDTRREFIRDANAPYAHPYFWSPFVLIGNWR
jgi:CHAT domain-containing protein/Tfp pilus assembly protein PilF